VGEIDVKEEVNAARNLTRPSAVSAYTSAAAGFRLWPVCRRRDRQAKCSVFSVTVRTLRIADCRSLRPPRSAFLLRLCRATPKAAVFRPSKKLTHAKSCRRVCVRHRRCGPQIPPHSVHESRGRWLSMGSWRSNVFLKRLANRSSMKTSLEGLRHGCLVTESRDARLSREEVDVMALFAFVPSDSGIRAAGKRGRRLGPPLRDVDRVMIKLFIEGDCASSNQSSRDMAPQA
jgi:hypothetical protein